MLRAATFGLVVLVVLAVQLDSAPRASAAERYVDEIFSSVTVNANIIYGEAVDEFGNPEQLKLDLYRPTGDQLLQRPAIIFAHGGSFTGGDKALPDPVSYSTRMAKRGYVVASINYRLREGGYPPEEQGEVVFDAKHDMQAAVRWFRANAATYAVDETRISVAGYSAGAATALFAAFIPEDVGESGNPDYPSDVSASISISGGMGNAADGAISPGDPPVLLIHGTADATVPYANATGIVAAANADSVPNELHTLSGAGHSKFGSVYMAEMAQVSGEFLNQHVVGGLPVGGRSSLATAPTSREYWWTRWSFLTTGLLLSSAAIGVWGNLRRTRP